MAYVLERDGARQLYLRSLDAPHGLLVAGSEGAFDPFFSPDGQWVGFFARNMLAEVRVSDGAVTEIAAAPDAFGGSWGSSGTILFAADEGRRLVTVSADGGEPRAIEVQGGRPELVRHGSAQDRVAGLVCGQLRLSESRGTLWRRSKSRHRCGT